MFESLRDWFEERAMNASFERGVSDGEAAANDEAIAFQYDEGFAFGYDDPDLD